MDETQKARTAACRSPLQHLQVSIRIAKGEDGTPSDEFVDGNRLANFVVDEIDLGQARQHGLAVAHLKLGLDCAANDLLRRNAIDLFCPGAHELNATS